MTFLYYTLLTLLMFVAVLLILVILIQKGRGGGLSSSFGGGGGSTAFGAKTGDVLTWATSVIFGIFIVLAVLLDLVVNAKYNTASNPANNPLPMSSASGQLTPEQQKFIDQLKAAGATTAPVVAPAVAPTTAPSITLPTVTAPTTAGVTGLINKADALVKTATTQGTGVMNATTQKAGNLLNGGK